MLSTNGEWTEQIDGSDWWREITESVGRDRARREVQGLTTARRRFVCDFNGRKEG